MNPAVSPSRWLQYPPACDRETPRQVRVTAIDQLRGIAIIGVVSMHCVGAAPTGYAALDFVLGLGRYGVQLFFVVSAITMMMMWDSRAHLEARPVASFYVRRALRILPMFWLALLAYLAIDGVGPRYFAPNGIGILEFGLTLVTLHGLWPSAFNSVVPGGWSIAVEMMFYAVFPLVVRFAVTAPRLWLLMLATCLFGLAAARLVAVLGDHVWADIPRTLRQHFFHFSFARQVIYFLVGIQVYRLLRRSAWPLALPRIVGVVAIATLLVLVYLLLGRGDSLVGLVLLVFVFVALKSGATVPVLASIGRRSYSIYLVHFAVLEAVVWGIARLDLPQLSRLPVLFVAVLCAAYAISGVTGRLVEEPGIRFGRKLAQALNRSVRREGQEN